MLCFKLAAYNSPCIEEVEFIQLQTELDKEGKLPAHDDAEFSPFGKGQNNREGKPQARAKVAWQAMTLGRVDGQNLRQEEEGKRALFQLR
jgi:hypothetical protein